MARTKAAIKKEVVQQMTTLGTYKAEYKNTIDIFVGMLHEYETFQEQFEESGYQVTEEHTNAAGATNTRKVPLYSAMEKLRTDIGTYSNLLCLNVKALNSITVDAPKKSKLGQFLKEQ
jgi:hypothetical protein